MANMKTITIDGVTYTIWDDESRRRLDTAESNIQSLQSGKADSADIPSNVSDLNDDVGILTEVPVEDVEIDGESIITSKTASIPRASASKAGVIKFDPSTEAGTNYADIYANEQEPSRVPLLDQNNELMANQLPAATTSTKGAMSAEDKSKLNGILSLVYPVGSIYMSVNDTDPGSIFGGTWERIEDRFLLAASSTYAAGATGGSADSVVPSHTHTVTATVDSAGLHSHVVSGNTGSCDTHRHSFNTIGYPGSGSITTQDTAYANGAGSQHTRYTEYGGAHTHPINLTSQSSGAHTHTVTATASTVGESATGKNMPPYLAVYVWKRTA